MVVFVPRSWFMPEPWDAGFPLQRESPESPQGRCGREGRLPLALLVRGHPRSSKPGLPGLHNSRAVLLSFGARGSTHPAPLSSPEPALAGMRGELQAAVVSWVHRQPGQGAPFPPPGRKIPRFTPCCDFGGASAARCKTSSLTGVRLFPH